MDAAALRRGMLQMLAVPEDLYRRVDDRTYIRLGEYYVLAEIGKHRHIVLNQHTVRIYGYNSPIVPNDLTNYTFGMNDGDNHCRYTLVLDGDYHRISHMTVCNNRTSKHYRFDTRGYRLVKTTYVNRRVTACAHYVDGVKTQQIYNVGKVTTTITWAPAMPTMTVSISTILHPRLRKIVSNTVQYEVKFDDATLYYDSGCKNANGDSVEGDAVILTRKMTFMHGPYSGPNVKYVFKCINDTYYHDATITTTVTHDPHKVTTVRKIRPE